MGPFLVRVGCTGSNPEGRDMPVACPGRSAARRGAVERCRRQRGEPRRPYHVNQGLSNWALSCACRPHGFEPGRAGHACGMSRAERRRRGAVERCRRQRGEPRRPHQNHLAIVDRNRRPSVNNRTSMPKPTSGYQQSRWLRFTDNPRVVFSVCGVMQAAGLRRPKLAAMV